MSARQLEDTVSDPDRERGCTCCPDAATSTRSDNEPAVPIEVFDTAIQARLEVGVREVTREELRVLLDAGTVSLVEALSAQAYEAEHLPGAVNVPGELTPDLAANITADRARTVVVYCSGPTCSRSKVTAAAFERLGYTDVRVYPGGKLDWWQAGLPLVGSRTGAGV